MSKVIKNIKMNVVGFVGSPRNGGNTEWAVRQILAGAKEQGAETHMWRSGDLVIKPCRGCLGCVQSDKCVINDDMRIILNELENADALVLGSPVYMGQMSAQAKIFTDRLFSQITPRFSPRFKEKNAGKKLILAFTQGNPDPDMFREYFDYTKRMFQLLEFDVKDVQIIAGTRAAPACDIKGLGDKLKLVGSSLTRECKAEVI